MVHDKKTNINSVDANEENEFWKIIKGFIKKFSTTIKTVVLTIFPQVSIIVNICFFVQNFQSCVRNFFNPKPKPAEEKVKLIEDDTVPRKKKNKYLTVGTTILKNTIGTIKALIFGIFPQLLLVSRIYLFTKTAINYFRGNTVRKEVIHKKKRPSKVESALLKLDRFIVVFKQLILAIFPSITRIFNLNPLNAKALNYVKGQAFQAIQKSEKPNFIQLLLEVHNKANFENEAEDSTQTKNKIMSQCIMFLFNGLQPVSNLLCVTIYELMKNPEIQEKLHQEILAMNEQQNSAELSYEALQKSKYLDMVLSESLRKWPSQPILDRVCSKPYILTDDDGNVVQEFKQGDNVCVSVYGSHFDEENFENPFTFDPERFRGENQLKIKPFTYFPFGSGYRSCKGESFGLLVAKTMLYHLILEYEFVSGLKTVPDLFAVTRKIQLKQSEFFWIKLNPRKINSEPQQEALVDAEEKNWENL